MGFATLFLCLLACLYAEAGPHRGRAVRSLRQKYADCPIGEPEVMGTINGKGSVPEASGIAYSRCQEGVIWTFNDKGNANKVFAISEQGERRVEEFAFEFN